MELKNDKKIYIFLAIVAYQSIGANIAHPVTPTLITELGLPSYSFGLFFAGMSFTNFLFSPMWAKLAEKIGSRKILGICCIGYGLGQVMFASLSTVGTIMVARLVSGFFVSGIMVSYLAHTVFISQGNERGRNLAYLATIVTVFGTFGYFIGGMLGNISVLTAFICQVIVLITSGIFFYLCVESEGDSRLKFDWRRDANPFLAFYLPKRFRTEAFVLIFLCVFLTSVGTTGFDQTFNYYIKDIYNFSTGYNGIIKAVIGVISFLFNMTLCLWLFKHTNTKKSTMYVLAGCGISIIASVAVSSTVAFIVCVLIFFGFNSLYIPLLQDLSVQNDDGTTLAGMYNAMKSLGMIIGALYAGFVYDIYEKLPFIIAGIAFFVSIIILIRYKKCTD